MATGGQTGHRAGGRGSCHCLVQDRREMLAGCFALFSVLNLLLNEL